MLEAAGEAAAGISDSAQTISALNVSSGRQNTEQEAVEADFTGSTVEDSGYTEQLLTENDPKDEKQPRILAEVMSYIFNGGVIALILPSGFFGFRKDKSKGQVTVLRSE